MSHFTIDEFDNKVHYVNTLYDAEQIIKWLSSNIVTKPVILFRKYNRTPLFGYLVSQNMYRYELTIPKATESYLASVKNLSQNTRIIQDVEYIDVL